MQTSKQKSSGVNPLSWAEMERDTEREIRRVERRLDRLRKLREMAKEKAAAGEPFPVEVGGP